MIKSILLHFDEQDWKYLKKAKLESGNPTWEKFLLKLVDKGVR